MAAKGRNPATLADPNFYILHSPFFILLPVRGPLQQPHPSLTVGALTFIMPP